MTDAHQPGTLLDRYDALLVDLDGVVYRGSTAVPHAVESLTAATSAGAVLAFVTNNAARPPSAVAEHLRELGLACEDHDVVTSAQAGAREVAARVPAGSRVLAVGGPGVALALEARGLVPVRSASDDPAAVMMGFGPDVSWRELAEAAYAVGSGAVFVATNTDTSIPTARGIAPGNGTLVGAVQAATGRAPVVAGKPYAPLMRESVERVGAQRPLVVGDRLDTDVEAGHVSGIPSLLVLTGVTDVETLLAAPEDRRPTYVAADLRGLLLPAAATQVQPTAAEHPDVDGLAGLRAACRAAWSAADRGAPTPPRDLPSLEAAVAAALA
ncbi:MAG: HAD-IIA family hydrolase [Candidatus Nanopelagicales bacterium]